MLLIPLVNKCVKCLLTMAEVGSVGTFDFAKSFLQKNLLRLMLQAKVIDKEFLVEADVWHLPLKNDPAKVDFMGNQQHLSSLGYFRALVKEVSN